MVDNTKKIEYALILIISISALAINVVIPGIPAANTQLEGGNDGGHLITISYLWGYCIGQIPLGLLADRYGRRPIMLIGLCLFTVSGLLSSFTTNINLMLIARFFQGIGGAVGPVVARAVARDIASGKHLSKLMATLMNALAIVPLVAPVLGTLIMAAFGWRGPFAFSFLLGILGTLSVWLFIPETLKPQRPKPSQVAHIRNSILKFFSSAASCWGMGLIVTAFFGYLAMVSSIASILHDVYGMDASGIGLMVGIILIPYVMSSTLNKRLTKNLSPSKLLSASLYVYAFVAVLTAGTFFIATTPLWLFSAIIMIYLIGLGISFPNATVVALSEQAETTGFAAGLIGTLQIGAGAFGALLSASFYQQTTDSLLLVMFLASVSFSVIYLIRPGQKRRNRPVER